MVASDEPDAVLLNVGTVSSLIVSARNVQDAFTIDLRSMLFPPAAIPFRLATIRAMLRHIACLCWRNTIQCCSHVAMSRRH